MSENLASFEQVLQWGQELPVKVNPDLFLMARSDSSRDNLAHRLRLAECEMALRKIIHYGNNYQAALADGGSATQRPRQTHAPVCGIGTYMMCVSAAGTFYPCPGFQVELGDARVSAVREVWMGSERLAEPRGLRLGSFPGCLSCEAWDYCVPCLARFYNESGGNALAIPEAYCRLSELNRSVAEPFRLASRLGGGGPWRR